jgi:hypothetical protein
MGAAPHPRRRRRAGHRQPGRARPRLYGQGAPSSRGPTWAQAAPTGRRRTPRGTLMGGSADDRMTSPMALEVANGFFSLRRAVFGAYITSWPRTQYGTLLCTGLARNFPARAGWFSCHRGLTREAYRLEARSTSFRAEGPPCCQDPACPLGVSLVCGREAAVEQVLQTGDNRRLRLGVAPLLHGYRVHLADGGAVRDLQV